VDPQQLWCKATVMGADGEVLAVVDVAGERPDMAGVERIARMALESKRGGRRLVLSDVSPRFRELLVFAGLLVEVQGQAEGREQVLEVQEREEVIERSDLAVGDVHELDGPG